MASAPFSLDLLPVGHSQLVVNTGDGGPLDLTGLALGGQLQWAEGQPTVLTLFLAGTGHVEGEGIVQVAPSPSEDDTEAVVRFLAAVDPKQLHAEAMATPGAARDIAKAHIDTLLRIASGGG